MVPRRRARLLPVAALAGALSAQLSAQAPAVPAGAQPGGNDLEPQIRAALEKARPPLLAHLRCAVDGPQTPGLLGLLCLAALHDGVPVDDPALAAALQRLADARLYQTYELSLRLLVAEACATFPQREPLARRDARELLTHRADGAFGYVPNAGNWDLSNTQYAALGLRAAVALGVEVERRVWVDLADAVLDHQHDEGGFGYSGRASGNRGLTPSMTAAGIAVLAICRQHLAANGRTVPEIDRRVKKAWKWLGRNAGAIGDPEVAWSFYFHYGLERAAILDDVAEVGGVDWYRTGAKMFVDRQHGGGGWTNATDSGPGQRLDGGRGNPVETAFAVLFLRRKFQRTVGAVTPSRPPLLTMLSAQSTPAAVEHCSQGLVQRGKPALPDVLKALRDDLPQRRRAAAQALAAITGQDFGIDPERDAEPNRDALRKAELWYLQHR